MLVNRTNNPLERVNRTIGEKFPTHHPGLVQFMETIKEVSNRMVDSLREIDQQKRSMPSPPDEPYIYSVPSDYYV